MGEHASNVDPQKLNRDWQVFISQEDPNHRLDSPGEALEFAQKIEADLGDDEYSPWKEKYGKDNLRAWQGIFRWQGEEGFELASRWSKDAPALRQYLKVSHLYEEPTIDIEGSETNNIMGYTLFADRTVSPRYYNQPPSGHVEKRIYELCAKVGGAENAIALIKEFKRRYPEQFHHGGVAGERIPFFDGRKPLQLARALEIMTALSGDPHLFSFLQRVDATLGWTFSFQTADAYLRFHKQWQGEGDAFFEKLKIRAELNAFIEENDLEEEIDEAVIQKVVELDPQTRQHFWTLVSENGVEHFFIIFGSKKYPRWWEGQKFRDGSPSERLDLFLSLLKQRGPDFFKGTHELVGFSEKISLDFLPLYLLAHGLGEQAENILPKIKRLLVGHDPEERKVGVSTYWWGAYFYAPFVLQSDVDEARRKLPGSLANVLIFLEGRGSLERTLDDLQRHFSPRAAFFARGQVGKAEDLAARYILQTLALAGTRRGEKGELEEDRLSPDNWPHKIFWATMAVDARHAPRKDPNDFVGSDGAASKAFHDITDVVDLLFYRPVLTGKMPPPPSPSDVERLRRWVDRMTQKRLFDGDHPEGISFLLWHGVLGSNKGVPTDEELTHIETLMDVSQNWFHPTHLGGYARLVFLCKVRKELWEKAPNMTAAITDAIFYRFRGWTSDSMNTVSVGLLLENEEVKRRLILLEEALNRLTPEARGQMLSLFSRDIKFEGALDWVHWPERLPVSLDACLAILSQSTEEVLSFLEVLRSSNIRELSFADPLVFQKLFDYYKQEGEEKLRKVLDDWSDAGLELAHFNGDGRFFALDAKDIERLETVSGQARLDFELAAAIIAMNDEEFRTAWEFFQSVKPFSISFETALPLKDIPHIRELIQLFLEEGIFRERMTNDLNTTLRIYGREIRLLAEKIHTTRRVLERLNSYGDYQQFMMHDAFRVFGGLILMNDEAIIGHLARIVEFEARYKHSFFAAPNHPDEIVVYGERAVDEHPLSDEDAFTLLDYPFWRYGMTPRVYDEILQGRSKEDLAEELLIQFAGLETRVRQRDKSYAGLESVSRGLLHEVPFSKLLKMQWLLNNLNSSDFLKAIHEEVEADFQDPLSEHGGLVRQAGLGARSIDSLQEPLRLVVVPSAKVEDNRERLEQMEARLRAARDEKEKREIEEQIASLQVSMDTEYQLPHTSEVIGAGAAFFHYHLHSVGDGKSGDYSGPSKPDLTCSLAMGDGLVITRLDAQRFNVDYYFSYPVLLSNGNTDWKSVVVDMGVY